MLHQYGSGCSFMTHCVRALLLLYFYFLFYFFFLAVSLWENVTDAWDRSLSRREVN
jgi:hypothetical protein